MVRSNVMLRFDRMSGTAATPGKGKGELEFDPDSVVVPIHLPKRLPYRPSIPAARLKRIVARVVKERQASERKTGLNGTTQ